MSAAIQLRDDCSASELRALAKSSLDADQCRRLLALAVIADGGRRTAAAELGGVGLQTVRDWVVRFNARGPDGVSDGKASGQTPKLATAQLSALAQIAEAGPDPAVHGVVRWRRKDLVQWVFEEFGVHVDETTVGRWLKQLGFSHISARPQHPDQDPRLIEAFKKTSQPSWRRSRPSYRPAYR